MRARGRRRTLAAQLLAALVAVVALTLLVVSVAARQSVAVWLTRELDSSVAVQAAAVRPADAQNPIQALRAPGIGPGALRVTLTAGGGQGGYIRGFSVQALTDEQVAAVRAALAEAAERRAGPPHGRQVQIPGLGPYRIATTTAGGHTVVVGQSLEGIAHTVSRLTATLAVLAVPVALIAIGLGTVWIRRKLAPLEKVAGVAHSVTERDLLGADVVVPRVAGADRIRAAEVSAVADALNGLLATVESSFAERARTERALRQFVADASHELRTPLAAVAGWTQLLQRGATAPAEGLGHIRKESDRMARLVDDLLTLARLDQGPEEAGSAATDVVPVLADAIAAARAAGPDHRYALDVDPAVAAAGGAGARIGAEPLARIVTNLLTNARVHTPAGTRVDVAVRMHGAAVRIIVADDGPGIPADVTGRVFDRFVRADPARTSGAGASSGLGLAIVRASARAAGGDVVLEPSEVGARFVVTLPAA